MAQRYRNVNGEIDIIARKRNCIIAVEVKKRSTYDRAIHSVTYLQRQRVAKALRKWLSYLRKQPDEVRFDVIAIGRLGYIKHIQNAWQI